MAKYIPIWPNAKRAGLSLVASIVLILSPYLEARGADNAATFFCAPAMPSGESAGLCRALAERLRVRFSALKIESQSEEQASVKGYRVEFVPVKISRNGISGQLRWREGDRKEWITGPTIQTVVMDASLNDEILQEFARNLVAASKF